MPLDFSSCWEELKAKSEGTENNRHLWNQSNLMPEEKLDSANVWGLLEL